MAPEYAPPPPKPKSWSEKRYREVHDSRPCRLKVYRADGSLRAVIQTAGPVSAEVMARTYRRGGETVVISYA